jgi:hypothetical protein
MPQLRNPHDPHRPSHKILKKILYLLNPTRKAHKKIAEAGRQRNNIFS